MPADKSTDSLAVVRRCRNEAEAAIVVASLSDAGIEARIEGANASTIMPVPWQSFEASVLVRESDLARAREVLPPEHEPQIEMDAETQVPEPPDGANALRFWLRVVGVILIVCLLATFVAYLLIA